MRKCACLLIALLAFPGASQAKINDIGMVLMHGKGGGTNRVDDLARGLRDAGVRVTTPLMPWGRGRIYDRTYDQAMGEIDAAFAKLKADGARRLVVAGHSLGANAALGYAARRDGLSGAILLAAGHSLAGRLRDLVADDVTKAKAMIAAGNADQEAEFQDFNQGRRPLRRITARIYLSWFDPDGPAAMAINARNFKPGAPLLWISGERERISKVGRGLVFDKLPPHPLNRYLMIPGSHVEIPANAVALVLAWLRSLQ